MKKKINIRLVVLVAMILVAASARLFLVFIPNFAPIGAMALFGAANFSKRYQAFLFPLGAMWLSDLVINNYLYPRLFPDYYDGTFAWGISPWVYGAFALVVVLGWYLLEKVNVKNVVIASLSASVLFFLLTNFGVWMAGTMYPMTAEGLMTCFMAGIPFFGNTLAGDLFFSGVLFGVFELLQQRLPSLRLQKVFGE